MSFGQAVKKHLYLSDLGRVIHAVFGYLLHRYWQLGKETTYGTTVSTTYPTATGKPQAITHQTKPRSNLQFISYFVEYTSVYSHTRR